MFYGFGATGGGLCILVFLLVKEPARGKWDSGSSSIAFVASQSMDVGYSLADVMVYLVKLKGFWALTFATVHSKEFLDAFILCTHSVAHQSPLSPFWSLRSGIPLRRHQ
jgi:hypothetical protein